MTAAWELTRPELECRYDVTVYTLGWRLGGKGASGRNAAMGDRIEEHGLHMWFGFYRNAFRMMREVFEQLDALPGSPPGGRFRTVEDAFSPCRSLVLWDRMEEGWEPVTIPAPERSGSRPWDPEGSMPTFWEVAQRVLELLQEAVEKSPAGTDAPVPTGVVGLLDRARHAAAQLIGKSARTTRASVWKLAEDLGFARDDLRQQWGHYLRRHPKLLLAYSGVDLFAAVVKGLVTDKVFKNGFDSINEHDLRAWLRHHGASELSIGKTFAESSPILRAIYDVAFLFPNGDVENASAAAGTAINDFLRLVGTYRGALYYKMNAGMGDAIFAPLYLALTQQTCPVTFRFFSEVEALHLDGTSVKSIDIIPQAALHPTTRTYEPLVFPKGLPSWPNEPLWRQLADQRTDPPRFETHHDPLNRKGSRDTLLRGRDFQHIVLAIPVGALETIASELIDAQKDRFGAMVHNKTTVATQAFQVWMTKTSKELGGPNNSSNVSATFVEPLDTYCDMSHLLAVENRGNEPVAAIGYFCGVLPDAQALTPEDGSAHVKANALDFLNKNAGRLWPGACPGGAGTPIDWDILLDPKGGIGMDRFNSQYWRANTAAWERYVSTPARSVKHRLEPGGSGFDNLVLAGDWTKNGIDGGCVEAAVLSGIQAAQAIISPGTGFDGDPGDTWLDPPA